MSTGPATRADLVVVPTVDDLVKHGLAKPIPTTRKGEVQAYRISPEGQTAIYDAMAHNAAIIREHPELHDWVPKKETA